MTKFVAIAIAVMTATRSLAAQAPDSARIYYRQAAQKPRGSAEAIDLYQRYVKLVPDDAWGYLALAEAQAAGGHFSDAEGNLNRAARLAPGEEDVKVVRQRISRAHRNAAPAFQPRTSFTRDSDGNQLFQTSLASDITSSATQRFGASLQRAYTSDDVDKFSSDEARLTALFKSPTTRFELSGGATRLDGPSSFTTAVGRARLRYVAPKSGPLVDLRASRAPFLVSPLLIVNRVTLAEARGTFEVPIGGRLRLRANGQVGDLSSADIDTVTIVSGTPNRGRRAGTPITRSTVTTTTSHNTRVGYGGALVMRTGASSEISANVYQLHYQAQAKAGYFAPDKAQLFEVGSYTEIYSTDPVTISFDVGAGIQRTAEHGAEFGKWTPSLRGWGMLTTPLSRAVDLNFEVDAYKSQLSTVATSASWNSLSGAVFVRWLIGI